MDEKDRIIRLNLDPSESPENHQCQSYRDGDWIIFRCPECADYERRLNWRTGEMMVRNSRPEINHFGRYEPTEYREAFENTN